MKKPVTVASAVLVLVLAGAASAQQGNVYPVIIPPQQVAPPGNVLLQQPQPQPQVAQPTPNFQLPVVDDRDAFPTQLPQQHRYQGPAQYGCEDIGDTGLGRHTTQCRRIR